MTFWEAYLILKKNLLSLKRASMKVLITGATGLVGQAITRVLHAKGIAVHYLTTRKEKITASENLQGFYWNPNTGAIDLACFSKVSAIINLAGAPIAHRWTAAYKKKILQSRVDSLKTLWNALEKIDTSHLHSFVSASAIGLYPSSLFRFYEEDETEVDNSFLGEVVQQWEAQAELFKGFAIKVAKVRIGLVLSNQGGALPKIAAPVKNFVGAPLGSGEQWQSWIHIEDLARLFVFLLENKLQGTFNGVAPRPVTNSKMTKVLAQVLHKPLWLPHVPKWALRTLLGEMASLLLASHQVSSKKIEKSGFHFQYPHIRTALEHLYSPTKPPKDLSAS